MYRLKWRRWRCCCVSAAAGTSAALTTPTTAKEPTEETAEETEKASSPAAATVATRSTAINQAGIATVEAVGIDRIPCTRYNFSPTFLASLSPFWT
jgi:hypothetical protein